MTSTYKWNVIGAAAVVLLLAAAYILRFPAVLGDAGRLAGIIRSIIFMGLFSVWAVSLRNRVIQKQTRKYMSLASFFILLWFLTRTIKYNIVPELLFPHAVRYLWYIYYLPMVFLPLMGLYIAMSAGKPEGWKADRKTLLLLIPPSALFTMVVTNDLHQFVFRFPEDDYIWKPADYSYEAGYYMVFAWFFICLVSTFVILYRKRRITGSRGVVLIPYIPMALLIVYNVVYTAGFPWVRVLFGDITAVTCLMFISYIELCMFCGLIQANTRYMELFDASTVGMQITDENYIVKLSSQTAKHVSGDVLKKTASEHVMLEGGFRLSGADITGGHVVWSEDINPLLDVLLKLKEAGEELEDINGILEEENRVRAREAQIAEQTALYNIIRRETASQIAEMEKMITRTEEAESEEEKRNLLKRILVLGVYIKRRSNLVFLSDKSLTVDFRELELAVRESMSGIELCGIVCSFGSEITRPVPCVYAIEIYDFLEKVIERSLDSMTALAVYIRKEGTGMGVTVRTDSDADFDDMESESVSVYSDEDGEKLLVIKTGGV